MATDDLEAGLCGLSKAELRALLRLTQKRLSRVKHRSSSHRTVASSDDRVQKIADEIRSLAQSEKMRRSEVLALVAGAMRIKMVTNERGRGPAAKTGDA